MKKHNDSIHIKRILKQGVIPVPSADFNKIVLERYLSEREQVSMKPAVNYTLLMVLDTLILLLTGFGLYIHVSETNSGTLLLERAISLEQISIVVTAIIIFTLFTILTDICEDRGILQK